MIYIYIYVVMIIKYRFIFMPKKFDCYFLNWTPRKDCGGGVGFGGDVKTTMTMTTTMMTMMIIMMTVMMMMVMMMMMMMIMIMISITVVWFGSCVFKLQLQVTINTFLLMAKLCVMAQPLKWCHNERDCVKNHGRLDSLLNFLFRRWSKKPQKVRVTGICEGNSSVTGEFP